MRDAAALTRTIRVALEELAEDARDYLEKLEQLRTTPKDDAEVYEDAEVALETAVTVLMVHSTSAHELLDALDEATDDPGLVSTDA
jgi:uncharacterized membrane protein